MKRSLYFFPFAIGFLIGLAPVWAQPVARPRIVFEERVFDAKEVKEGEIIEHTFRLRKTGAIPLEIRDVRPG